MPSDLDLDDIQGNLLRGYRMRRARHFALQVKDAARARGLIGAMAGGDQALPQITRATPWPDRRRPGHALNLGLSYAGLQALGVGEAVLKSFPRAFREGPAEPARAASLGDSGDSDPMHWSLGGRRTPGVHLLLSVHADREQELDAISACLRSLFDRHGMSEICVLDAQALQDSARVHFGYRDGISQPRIQGTPPSLRRAQLKDPLPEAPTGDFLLGRDYLNSFDGNHLGDLPPALGDNATYGAFRLLYQDVPAFERLLRDTARRWNLEVERLAAKLMGRWRNGVPLSLSPDAAVLPSAAQGELNDFDYAPSPTRPDRYDDPIGLRCPVGSHIRRLNPRSGLAMGKPYSRRLVRRGMPYGEEYQAEAAGYADDGVDRGLVGYFLCGDLELQFEFIQRTWVNDDISAAGLRGTREPIIGAHPEHGGRFVIRTDNLKDPIVITDLPRLVSTRGSVYCLLPGIGGLRHLASL